MSYELAYLYQLHWRCTILRLYILFCQGKYKYKHIHLRTRHENISGSESVTHSFLTSELVWVEQSVSLAGRFASGDDSLLCTLYNCHTRVKHCNTLFLTRTQIKLRNTLGSWMIIRCGKIVFFAINVIIQCHNVVLQRITWRIYHPPLALIWALSGNTAVPAITVSAHITLTISNIHCNGCS